MGICTSVMNERVADYKITKSKWVRMFFQSSRTLTKTHKQGTCFFLFNYYFAPFVSVKY